MLESQLEADLEGAASLLCRKRTADQAGHARVASERGSHVDVGEDPGPEAHFCATKT
jgi:hypothetical protein